MNARHTLEEIEFFYVPSPNEPCEPGPGILSHISRPTEASREIVTPIEGIRSHFFFVMIDESTIWMRHLSCHCERCLRGEYKLCDNEDAGEWKEMKVIKKAAGTPASLRSVKSALDAKRRELAKRAVVDQLIAVESEDDHEGFTWWLCVVTKAAYKHDGKASVTADGVKLKTNGWYMEVMYYERSPATSETTFRLDRNSNMIIDVEGVVYVEPMQLTPVRPHRSRARAKEQQHEPDCLDAIERSCSDCQFS